MGILVPCPHCGSRPYTEFSFGGELRPAGATDPGQDFRDVYLGANAAGEQEERWFHALGCRRWLTVRRDTRVNEIHGDA